MTEDTLAQKEKVDALPIQDLKIMGNHYDCFRFKQWADITGVKMCYPPNLEPRICYQIQFEDGFIDYVPISDSKHYLIETK